MRDESNKRSPADLKDEERQGKKEDICRRRDLRVNISWQNCFSGDYEASSPKMESQVRRNPRIGKIFGKSGYSQSSFCRGVLLEIR